MPEEEVISDPQSPSDGDPATGESGDAEESAGEPGGAEVQRDDAAVAPVIDSPPLAAQPLKLAESEPRMRLHQLAKELVRNRNRRLLIEFLQLRRALQ